MGVDTKSGPTIIAALHEVGVDGAALAGAVAPLVTCNSANQTNAGLKVEQPVTEYEGHQRTGKVGAKDARRGVSQGLNINTTSQSLPPQITPAQNARGPVGANGNRYPVVDPQFSSVPGGSGSGAFYGNNVGVARSPVYGTQGVGDFSTNSSGGIDVSVAGGAQPANTVDAGSMPTIDEKVYPFDPAKDVTVPEVSVGGGAHAGGGGGGGGDPGEGGGGDPGEEGPCKDEDNQCDLFVDGTICATKVFADNLHLRWGTTEDEIKAGKAGSIKLTPKGKNAGADERETEDAEPDDETADAESDSSTADDADDDDADLPPCTDPGDDEREDVDEDGQNDETEPDDSPTGGGEGGAGEDAGGGDGAGDGGDGGNWERGDLVVTVHHGPV